MTTNLEKFNNARAALNKVAEEHVVNELGLIPKSLWRVGPAGKNYEPEEWSVDIVLYHPQGFYFDKRPSREQVKCIESIVDQQIDQTLVCIHVHTNRASAGCHLHDIKDKKTWSLSKDVMEVKAQELRKIYIPKDGQFKCRYCGKATNDRERLTRTIIARQYPNMRADFDYCSVKCAAHDQMAHEG